MQRIPGNLFMKKNFTLFLIKLLLYTTILYLLYSVVKHSIPEKFYFENTFYLFVFFVIITAVFHFGLLYSFAKSSRSFVSYYMMATALKLFLFLAIIIVYALLNTGQAIAFISNFFVIYVLFTVFEVTLVFLHFKSKNLENGNSGKAEISE